MLQIFWTICVIAAEINNDDVIAAVQHILQNIKNV